MKAINVTLYTMGAVVCIAVTMTVLRVCTGCSPPPGALPSPAHQWDLHDCRKSSEAYRDAGDDGAAEWKAYKDCQKEADERDRRR